MRWISSLLAVVMVAVSVDAVACPLCGGPPGQTWAELVAEADAVLLVKLVSVHEGDKKTRPWSVVDVVKVHKGKALVLQTKQLRVPEYLFGKPGDLFILNGSLRSINATAIASTFATDDTTNSGDSAIRKVNATDADLDEPTSSVKQELVWDLNQALTATAFDYIVAAPDYDAPTRDRLRFYAKFLEAADSTVATDAWSEFAAASYEDIVAVRDVLSPEKLRQWIANEDTKEPQRIGLYGLLLGLCGDEDDAKFLRQQITKPSESDIRLGIEGLMGGLLVLEGKEGLAFIEQSCIENASLSSLELYSVMQAIEFAWSSELERFGKPRLRQTMRQMLDHPDIREIAIRNLARWEDWDAVAQLPDIYASSREDDRGTTHAIVGYLLALQLSLKNDADSSNFTAGSELLATIRTDNPALVRSVERFFR